MDKDEIITLLEARFQKKKAELDDIPDFDKTTHAESSLRGRIAELSTLIYKITGENPEVDNQ